MSVLTASVGCCLHLTAVCDSVCLLQAESSSEALAGSEQQAADLQNELGAVQERLQELQEAHDSMTADAAVKAARLAHLEGQPITSYVDSV